MPTEIWVAIIGAVASLLAALIGLYGKPQKPPGATAAAPPAMSPPEYRRDGLVVAGAILLSAVIIAVVIHKGQTAPVTGPLAEDDSYASCLEAARQAGKAYVIESATMFVEIEDGRGSKPNERRSSVHIVYSVRALQDITRGSPVFMESYNTELTKEAVHWNGTAEERWSSPSGNAYNVLFDLKEGEVKTFATGQDFIFALPFPDNRPESNKNLLLRQNQDFVSYNNTGSAADYIHQLTIVVRSKTTPIKPARDDAAITFINQENATYSEVKFSPLELNKNGWHTLSASWTFIKPGQVAGIIFQWP